MWIITGQRDFYFACGIFVWAIPRPWSSRSSNIDVRQTSITSHLTTFYHVACVAGFKREKGKGGNSGAHGMGWRAPDFPSFPFSLSTPARRLSEAHVAAVFVVTQCGAELCMTLKIQLRKRLRCLLHHSSGRRHATLLPRRTEESCTTT